MKKALFATTALVASAGVASAQDLGISIEGFAEIGIAGTDIDAGAPAAGQTTGQAVDTEKMRFHNDIGFQFDAAGETDNGISFGFSVEFDDTNGSNRVNGAWGMDNEFAFISSGPVTFSMGEIDGALDRRVDEPAWGAALTDDHTTHVGFGAGPVPGNNTSANGFDGVYDNQIARLDYDMGAFGASLSVEQDDTVAGLDPSWAIGLSYNLELTGVALDFGAGYQTADKDNNINAGPTATLTTGLDTAWAFSIGADFDNGLKLAALYEQWTGDGSSAAFGNIGGNDLDRWVIGAGYDFNNFSVEANYGELTIDGGALDGTHTGWGLAAQYDFGGGLEAQFGYGSSSFSTAAAGVLGRDSQDTYSLGLVMSF